MEWITNALVNMVLLLAFIVVCLLWAGIVLLICWEAIEAWKEHNRSKNDEEYGEWTNRRNTL